MSEGGSEGGREGGREGEILTRDEPSDAAPHPRGGLNLALVLLALVAHRLYRKINWLIILSSTVRQVHTVHGAPFAAVSLLSAVSE